MPIWKLLYVILSPSTGSGQAPRRISADPVNIRFFVVPPMAGLLRMTPINTVSGWNLIKEVIDWQSEYATNELINYLTD